jgi:hypothetical protein
MFSEKSSTNAAASILDEHAPAITIDALLTNAVDGPQCTTALYLANGALEIKRPNEYLFLLWDSTNQCWQIFCYRCVVGVLTINASHGRH